MKTVICKTFTARITIGLTRMYSGKSIALPAFKKALLIAQEAIQAQYKIELSAKLSACEILFLGQDEPSIELEFIQYPRFPQEESALKKAIVELTQLMMLELEQNRVVIVFSDETLMLEQTDAIDPAIRL
ncbi:MAG TPA: hypothetical protein PLB11_08935 [Flavobacterium sp.]|nr:hypothetical protein [Flavobacterium sp.]